MPPPFLEKHFYHVGWLHPTLLHHTNIRCFHRQKTWRPKENIPKLRLSHTRRKPWTLLGLCLASWSGWWTVCLSTSGSNTHSPRSNININKGRKKWLVWFGRPIVQQCSRPSYNISKGVYLYINPYRYIHTLKKCVCECVIWFHLYSSYRVFNTYVYWNSIEFIF